MNERIRQLAEQAGLKWKAQPPHYTNTNNTIDFPVSANRDLEKFAELIVKECIEQGDTLAKHYIDTHPEQEQVMLLASIADYSNEIKQHFGVE